MSNSSHASSGASRVGNLDVVAGLDEPGVVAQLVVGEQKTVAEPQFAPLLAGEQLRSPCQVDDGVLGRTLRLAVEQVGDRRHGVELEVLVGVELQFHGVPRPSKLDALGLERLHGVGLELVVAGEAFVEADDSLRLSLGNGADQFQRQFALQAN